MTLTVEGEDGFRLDGSSAHGADQPRPASTSSPQAIGAHHQYPDGFVLYLGTMFAPVDDRDEPGHGFTHHIGDIVRIAEPRLGALINRVRHSEQLAPWTFGIAALLPRLSRSGLLTDSA